LAGWAFILSSAGLPSRVGRKHTARPESITAGRQRGCVVFDTQAEEQFTKLGEPPWMPRNRAHDRRAKRKAQASGATGAPCGQAESPLGSVAGLLLAGAGSVLLGFTMVIQGCRPTLSTSGGNYLIVMAMVASTIGVIVPHEDQMGRCPYHEVVLPGHSQRLTGVGISAGRS